MLLEQMKKLRRRAVVAPLFDGRVELSPQRGELLWLREEPPVGDKRL
jgi:hypothetical protein